MGGCVLSTVEGQRTVIAIEDEAGRQRPGPGESGTARVARPRVWRGLQFMAGVLLVGLAIRSIAANWQSLRAQPIEWQLSTGWIALSVLVVFASYAVLIEGVAPSRAQHGRKAGILDCRAHLVSCQPGKVCAGQGVGGGGRSGAGAAGRCGSVGGSCRSAGASGAGPGEWGGGGGRDSGRGVPGGGAGGHPDRGGGHPSIPVRSGGPDLSVVARPNWPAAARLLAPAARHPGRDGRGGVSSPMCSPGSAMALRCCCWPAACCPVSS